MTQITNLLSKIAAAILVLSQVHAVHAGGTSPVSPASKRFEARADRFFIKGDYARAVKSYEQAGGLLGSYKDQKLELELKMARLYTLLQRTEQAIQYYDSVYDQADTMLSVNDVCFFLDALRQTSQNQKAEIIARNYAFKSPYSRNQRYINTLYALSNQHHYYNKGDSDYAVVMSGKNGPSPEYWVGNLQGKPFYAISHSPLQDPLKIFYHRTQYFSLNDENVIPFRSIPRELQSGPVAFSGDNRVMVATGISYRNTGRIVNPGHDRSMYVTQLFYSLVNPRSRGWHRFVPLLGHQEGYSYAHPTFFNDGKSLIFSSDRPGGHGGMDLYVTDWNKAEQKWGNPVNLGPQVNTEGDEIYPQLIGEYLYFSSNGHEGFGGYDVYRIVFGDHAVIPGTLFHYSYPINSSHNDFGISIDGETGYFISDRRGPLGKDDIYTFDIASTAIGRDDFIGVSEEHSAMTGKLNVITGLNASNGGVNEKVPAITPAYRVPRAGEVLMSVYFDFNRHQVDAESAAKLGELLASPEIRHVAELDILGYADEFGSQPYNKKLSERRADAVAEFLANGRIAVGLSAEGRGQLYLSPEEYKTQMSNNNIPGPTYSEIAGIQNGHLIQERIRINQKVRRVDIVIKKMHPKP